MEEGMKAGDKVYRAVARLDGIEVAEATIVRAGPERITIDSGYHMAWQCRKQIKPSECFASREDALRDLLDRTRQNERDFRESMEAEQETARKIEAMLRTPTESSSS